MDSIYSILPTIIAIGIVFFIIIYLTLKLSKRVKKGYKTVNYILSTILILLPIYTHFRAYTLTISPMNFSYLNMIYASSLATGNLFHSEKEEHFKPYKVVKKYKKKRNIIVIMGESLSYKRMHLFGDDNNNTPYLDRLKNSPNFFYTKAVSCGVNTPVAVSSFFTLKREPQNISLLVNQKTNILKLAGDNGYSVAWLSMQDEGMSISSILKYATYIKLRKDYPKGSYDETLLKDLQNINWDRDNFIVLHFRANHSPYEEYIPPKFRLHNYNRLDYPKYKIDSYNDSIIYIDYLLNKIFKYMSSTHKNFRVYFTSDHGERLGGRDDNFKYGHSELDFEVAKVPFLIYSNKPIDIKKEPINHYQIGKMILKDLGYKLDNPNDNGQTYYINGLNRGGKSGFLEYNLSNNFAQ